MSVRDRRNRTEPVVMRTCTHVSVVLRACSSCFVRHRRVRAKCKYDLVFFNGICRVGAKGPEPQGGGGPSEAHLCARNDLSDLLDSAGKI